jgi:hypothetical protein
MNYKSIIINKLKIDKFTKNPIYWILSKILYIGKLERRISDVLKERNGRNTDLPSF